MVLIEKCKKTGAITHHPVKFEYSLLLHVLRKIKKQIWVFSMNGGICLHIESELRAMGYGYFNTNDNRMIHRLMCSWDEFSGDIQFPVHTNNKLTGYQQFHKTKFKFNQFTKYGKARRRLLDHMIKECETLAS